MRTSEEFENHVYGLIAEKKQRRQKRRRLRSAVLVLLVISLGFFWGSRFQQASPSLPKEEAAVGEAAPLPSMTLEKALTGNVEYCRFEKDGNILTISDQKTLESLCALLSQAVPSEAESAAPFLGSLTLINSNDESISLFVTEDGFCDESGNSYRAADVKSWTQELKSLLEIPEN